MVEKQTEYETRQTDPIYPFIKKGVFAGYPKFDAVHKPTKKGTRQFYDNLPGIYKDLRNFIKILTRFEFNPKEIETHVQQKIAELNEMIKRLKKTLEIDIVDPLYISKCTQPEFCLV